MGEVHQLHPPKSVAFDLTEGAAMVLEILRLLNGRPDWNWLIRRNGDRHLATVSSPDWSPPPLSNQGQMFSGSGRTPAEALRAARTAAERGVPLAANAVRLEDGEG